jgi:hypothetical protein
MNKRNLLIKFVMNDLLAAIIVWILFMLFRRTVNDAQIFENIRIFIPNYNYFTSLLIFPLACVFIHFLSRLWLMQLKWKRNLMLATVSQDVNKTPTKNG